MAARSRALRILRAPAKDGYRGRALRWRRPHAFKETYIARALGRYSEPTYLEIGVREGECFRVAPASRKIGIDPVASPTMKQLRRGEEYFTMTSDEFFAEQAPRVLQPASIHVALIDGLHEFRQVVCDLIHLEPYMRPDGLVFFDDMNPRTRKRAADMPTGEVDVPGGVIWNGDVWKIAAFLARARPDLTLRTVKADQGVGVLSGFGKSHDEDLQAEIERCKALDYSELENGREQLLHLVAPRDFDSILAELHGWSRMTWLSPWSHWMTILDMKRRLRGTLSRARAAIRRRVRRRRRHGRARKQTRELSRQGIQIAELGDGRKLICDLTVEYDRSVYLGEEEVPEQRLISKLLGPGDVFVDCGANIGLFTVCAAGLVGATGKVFAVEPVGDTFARLTENCDLNQLGDRVRLFNNALAADSGGEVTLAGEVHNTMRVQAHPTPGRPSIMTVTLDGILAGSPAVTGLKIDVEGYELEVLRGAGDTIAQFSPWILIEFNGELLDTRELARWDVHAFLTERQYRAHLPRSILAGDGASLPGSWVSPRAYLNLLYCRDALPVS